jgi:allantoin racemase
MRILLLKPYAVRWTKERELCLQAARPDTQVDFTSVSELYPISHVHHNYFLHKSVDAVAELAMKAEEDGYDGVCIACGADPGLAEARELVSIPVTSSFESAGHIASTMGHKFSVITTTDYAVPHMENLALLYGFGHKLASIRHLGIAGRDLNPSITPEERVVAKVNEVARKCVEHDGAEVIVLTATLAATMFTSTVQPPVTESGTPVLDALLAGLKMCELMVDLKQKMGIPPVSRVGFLKLPHEEEYRKLREFHRLPLRRGLSPTT